MAFFLDSSGLAKAYVAEVGSAWVLSLLNLRAAHELCVVRITEVEVASGLVRKVPAIAAAPLA